MATMADASTIQKIADIENEMAKTQKNKATSAHLGMLKVNFPIFNFVYSGLEF